MAQNKDILEDLLVKLKSVIQSCKGGVPLCDLESDYKFLIGTSIPFEILGYSSLEAFLQSIPNVVKLKKNCSGQAIAEAVTDASTAHLVKLISKQKDKPSKKRHVSKSYKTVKTYHNKNFRSHQYTKGRPYEDNKINQSYGRPKSRKSKENAIKQMEIQNQQNTKSYKKNHESFEAKSCDNSTFCRNVENKKIDVVEIQNQKNTESYEKSHESFQAKSCDNSRYCLNVENKKIDVCKKKIIHTDQGSLAVVIQNEVVDIPDKSDVKPSVLDNISQSENQDNCFEEDSGLNNFVSNILFVQNLVRPFTLTQLKKMLKETGNLVEEKFWIDKVKSKCFVTYETTDEAIKTKDSLNGLKWPDFSPKTLIVDFSTEEKLQHHVNKISPPKAVAEYIPPTSKYENRFLHRISTSPESKILQKSWDRFKPYPHSQQFKENKIPEKKSTHRVGTEKSLKFEREEKEKYKVKRIFENSLEKPKAFPRILTRSVTLSQKNSRY